jgi:LysM repeat protein
MITLAPPLDARRARRISAVLVFVALSAACGRTAPDETAEVLQQSSSPDTTAVIAATTTTPTTAPPATQPSYVVQQGDSLSQIADRFGVSTKALADFNGIADADEIKVGQTLNIPPTTAATDG